MEERLEDLGRSEEWEADAVHLFDAGVHEGEGDGVVGRFVDGEKGGVDDRFECAERRWVCPHEGEQCLTVDRVATVYVEPEEGRGDGENDGHIVGGDVWALTYVERKERNPGYMRYDQEEHVDSDLVLVLVICIWRSVPVSEKPREKPQVLTCQIVVLL